MQAAAYIRVSTDEQAEHGISIPAQKARLEAYCKAREWDIFKFYVDDGYSGKDLNRPAMQSLIEDAGRGLFNIVLVFKLDRLSRRQKDVLYLLEDVFDQMGTGFKSVSESFDTTTAFGKAALGMMAVFAQLERETIIERVRMAKRESARQGRFPGGPAPFGYKYISGAKLLEVDMAQAETVKRIYNQYLTGEMGYHSIAEDLERRGVPGPLNQKWLKQTVRKILTNPIYTGFLSHKGSLYPGRHDPIIRPETRGKVLALIKGRGAIRSAARAHDALLSGIIYCGECGARMRVKNVWQNYPCTDPKRVVRYYVCYSQDRSAGHMVRDINCRCGYKRAGEIEENVIRRLYKYSFDELKLRGVLEEFLSQGNDRKGIMRGLSQAGIEIESIEKKIDRWYRAFQKGALDTDQLIVRVNDLKARKNHLEEQAGQWNKLLLEKKQPQANITELLEDARNFPEIWEDAAPGERRSIITNLVRSVRVYKDNGVEVDFVISTGEQTQGAAD